MVSTKRKRLSATKRCIHCGEVHFRRREEENKQNELSIRGAKWEKIETKPVCNPIIMSKYFHKILFVLYHINSQRFQLQTSCGVRDARMNLMVRQICQKTEVMIIALGMRFTVPPSLIHTANNFPELAKTCPPNRENPVLTKSVFPGDCGEPVRREEQAGGAGERVPRHDDARPAPAVESGLPRPPHRPRLPGRATPAQLSLRTAARQGGEGACQNNRYEQLRTYMSYYGLSRRGPSFS